MQFLQKLKNKPLCNELIYIVIGLIILFLSLEYTYIYICLAIYLVYIVYMHKKVLIPLILLIVFFSSYSFVVNRTTIDDNKEYKALVTDVKSNGYVIRIGLKRVRIVDYNTELSPGNIVNIAFKNEDVRKKSYETDFDFKQYLFSEGIVGYAKVKYVSVTGEGIALNSIRYRMLNRLSKKLSPETYQYVEAMVFSVNNLDTDLKEGYSTLGISYILAISGMHIMFLYKVISWLLFKLFRYYKSTIPIVILSIYVAIIGFPSACMRALLFLILSKLNEKGNVQYSRVDILSLAFIIILISNPNQFYSKGFILSFLVSFLIILLNHMHIFEKGLISSYLSFILIYFVTLPITASFNNQISILALLFSPIIGTAVGVLLLPICYIVTICPFLDSIFKYIFMFLNEFVLGLSSINIKICIPSFSFIMVVIYYGIYLLFIYCLANKKSVVPSILFFSSYIIVLANIHVINPITRVTFIDVGQGDSALVELANNKGNILIDAYNSLDYLKSTGITHIDTLVLTHSDNDHIRDANEIIKYFNIKNIYVPLYDSFDGKLSYSYKTITYKNSFYVGGLYIDVLGPIEEFKEVNSNSVVLRFSVDGYSFLFTGDMTKEEEKTLIDEYGTRLSSTVLKVGHHGSSTSTSNEFVKLVNPKYSIISVKKNNSYNLPNASVLETLSKTKVYMTKDHGNIDFFIYKNKMSISPYR